MKLYFCGKPGKNYGWGTCNTNLIAQLSKLCEVEVVERQPTVKLDGPTFLPIVDFKLSPLFPVQATKVIGYCFTECPLDDDSRRNASLYDLILAGSTWNKQRIVDAGITTPCEVMVQGIDRDLFKPQAPSERKGFVVFSGGKYEFRKGQDYVATAMKTFMSVRKDAFLITAWHNLWKGSEQTMRASWLIDWDKPLAGMDMNRVFDCGMVAHEDMPKAYGLAHIGLFPNRCEAGNNLVMCEFMACGRPVIASWAHGHRDALSDLEIPTSPGPGPYLLANGSYDPAGWFNPEVSDIIAHLEHAYQHRDELIERGETCRKMVEGLTWEKCAKQVFEAAFGRPVE
jgi:glycosyltransferase involved in cell wall biosynthesis